MATHHHANSTHLLIIKIHLSILSAKNFSAIHQTSDNPSPQSVAVTDTPLWRTLSSRMRIGRATGGIQHPGIGHAVGTATPLWRYPGEDRRKF